jgi:hypothetical protein
VREGFEPSVAPERFGDAPTLFVPEPRDVILPDRAEIVIGTTANRIQK